MLLAVFFAGYRFGIRTETKAGNEAVIPLRAEERSWQDKLTKCHNDQHTFVTNDAVAKKKISELEEAARRQDLSNDEMYRRNEKLDTDSSVCTGELQAQFAQWQESDEKLAARIREISDVNTNWRVQIKRLTEVQAQSDMLLGMSLRRVREENFRLRALLGQSATEQDPIVLENAVLEKWSPSIDTTTLQEVREISTTENSTLKKSANIFVYNSSEHTELFFPTVKSDGSLSRPSYFGREGTSEVTKGTILGIKRRRIYSVAFLVKALYNYGLCAYRNNNPNFTYPDTFYIKPNSSRTHASELIDTPLLRFCIDCKRWANSTEFRLACLGDTVDFQYGTRDFWAVRSMIRYHSAFYQAAEDLQVNLGLIPDPGNAPKKDGADPLAPGNYLAAIYRSDSAVQRRCTDGVWARHTEYITKRYPKRNFYLSGRTAPMCSPPVAVWCDSVKNFVIANNITRVYVSTTQRASIELKKCQFPSNVDVSISTPRQREPEDQVLDQIILSKGQYLISDAYSDLAQVVTEAWLLNRRFKSKGLYII